VTQRDGPRLLHAGFAAVAGAVFVLFKLSAGRHFADSEPADPLR
jgi:hypothetical protein